MSEKESIEDPTGPATPDHQYSKPDTGSEDIGGEGVDTNTAMAVLAELPAPSPDSSKSLIGSTASTRDPVPTDQSMLLPAPAPAPHPGFPAHHTGTDGELGVLGVSVDPAKPGGRGNPEGSEDPEGVASTVRNAKAHQPGAGASVWVSLDDLDELTIVARAQDGDPQAFDWLISAYQGGVYRLCFRMLNDRSDAEDVVQETFIAAWRSLPKLTVPQAFIPWLYRTATNKCLDDLRRRRRRPADPTSDIDLEAQMGRSWTDGGAASGAAERGTIGVRQPVDPAQDVENQAQMRALADLLQTVPAGPRACWLLREVHDFSYAEIAAIVQLPESTVRGRIARAKRFLAEGMEPWR